MNKIEIKAMIPEMEYKRARVKMDLIDLGCLGLLIISLLVTGKEIKVNDELLKQVDDRTSQYNTANSQLDQLNQKYEELEIQYNELLNDARLQDKLEVFSEVE